MKVLLLYPRADHIKEFMAERPPLGLAYIAAYLEKEGHIVEILDLNISDNTKKELEEKIKENDVIGISILSVFYESTKNLIIYIRKINPNITIVVGGAHASALPNEVLEENDINFVIMGEGELTFAELLENLQKGTSYRMVNGIVFKQNGKIIQTPKREVIKNLDMLPFPARHLLKLDKYVNYFDNQRSTVMMTSRGCPYNCFYCNKNIGQIWRSRSARNVVDEIEEVYRKYAISVFYFHDDLFTLKKDRVIDICEEILKRNLRIRWICESRVNTIDEEMLRWMKKAGCRAIHYGVESGDQEIINKIGKGITLEQARKALALTKKVGIYSKSYFIIGFPWDTKETINKTINFALSLKTDELQFTMLMPYPGTKCWEEAIKVGSIDPVNINWDVFSPTNLEVKDKVFFTNNLSAEMIRSLRKKAYRKTIIHIIITKLREGNVKYLYNLFKEKKNLGLFKFLRNLFLRR